MEADGQRVDRTRALIARSGDEYLLASIQMEGDGQVRQDGRVAPLSRGSMAFYDSTRPYTLDFERSFRQLVVQVPKSALSGRDVSAATAVPLRAAGPGAPVSQFFLGLAREHAAGAPVYRLAYVFGQPSRDLVDRALRTGGCPACSDLGPGGDAVTTLNRGAITRPGISYTVIQSRADELVTPPETAFVREPGVVNQYVQDFCPADPVGHIGEAYDTNVWNLVANALEDQPARRFPCSAGSPG